MLIFLVSAGPAEAAKRSPAIIIPQITHGQIVLRDGDLGNSFCWINRVTREGDGFRVHLDHKPFNARDQRDGVKMPIDPSATSREAGSFLLARGHEIRFGIGTHAACALRIIDQSGEAAVEAESTRAFM